MPTLFPKTGRVAHPQSLYCHERRATRPNQFEFRLLTGLRCLPVAKRILKGIVKVIATVAGIVFIFDNRLSGTAGLVLLGSVIVLFLCVLVWLIIDEGETM